MRSVSDLKRMESLFQINNDDRTVEISSLVRVYCRCITDNRQQVTNTSLLFISGDHERRVQNGINLAADAGISYQVQRHRQAADILDALHRSSDQHHYYSHLDLQCRHDHFIAARSHRYRRTAIST